jgi:formate dehydrogenase
MSETPLNSKTGDDAGRKRRVAFPKGRQVDAAAVEQVRSALGDRPRKNDELIELLHVVHDSIGYLSTAHLAALAAEMKLAQTEVYEVASFYHYFDIIREGEAAPEAVTIRVCDGIVCENAGAAALTAQLKKELAGKARIIHAPCIGACDRAPAVIVGRERVGNASMQSVAAQVENEKKAIPSHGDLKAYRAEGGYLVLGECIAGTRTRESVLAEIDKSGLRGLGGAGFPTARKWRFLDGTPKPRIVAVNADEGEPGTFKDRHCFETKPHQVLEGILVAAWAVEADDVYIYLREEYPHCHDILRAEIAALERAGLTGGVRFHLRRGAGAYICGEETALLESLEGKRGLPRNKPPFPAQHGYFAKPTLVNNVETLYWVPEILAKGGDWYQNEGRPHFYSVSGRVKSPGVKLAPSGVTVRRLIDDYCGGMADGQIFKAYLPGGASGGILPAAMDDIPLDFGTLEPYGCLVGSAAVVILGEQDSVRDGVLNLLRFFADESCGQCTPCRLGCEKIVDMIEAGPLDRDLVGDLSETMRQASICGLGQAAPNPVMTALDHFADEMT